MYIGTTLGGVSEEDFKNFSEVEIPIFQIDFDYEVSYDKYDFVPVGTQVVLLNEDTTLVGLWGKS